MREVIGGTGGKDLWSRQGSRDSRSEQDCRPWTDEDIMADTSVAEVSVHRHIGKVSAQGYQCGQMTIRTHTHPLTTTKVWTAQAITPGTLPRDKGKERKPRID